MPKTYLSKNDKETKKIAEDLLKKIFIINNRKGAFVLALEGDLGGGKTTFLQGLAKGLGVQEKVLSPTFVIMKKFKISDGIFKNFYHFDCYRLENEKDLFGFGFEKIINNQKNIVAVEWADKIKKSLPKGSLWIKFFFVSDKKRKLIFSWPGKHLSKNS